MTLSVRISLLLFEAQALLPVQSAQQHSYQRSYPPFLRLLPCDPPKFQPLDESDPLPCPSPEHHPSGLSPIIHPISDLPVDDPKIDQGFIFQSLRNRNAQMVIEATIGLAHKLGIHVCLEGIENQQLRDFVLRYPADHIRAFTTSVLSLSMFCASI